jgi:hypothetical protein
MSEVIFLSSLYAFVSKTLPTNMLQSGIGGVDQPDHHNPFFLRGGGTRTLAAPAKAEKAAKDTFLLRGTT